MLIDALRIAMKCVHQKPEMPTTVTAQDPLELGMLAYVISRLTRIPYTVQVHGDYMSSYWTENSFMRRARRTVLPFVLRHATVVRVVSERIRRSLLAIGIGDASIVVLPIRPELELFLDARRTHKKWQTFTVLTASRLAPEKNIPLLVRAFKRLHDCHSDVRLRIAGEGIERARIEHEIDVCGLREVVTVLPWVHDIGEEMARANVFALASFHEAYGLVLIEALASGTPVVTTDVGCVGEVVRHEVHGLVVPVGDERTFGEALVRMYEDTNFRNDVTKAGQVCAQGLLGSGEDVYAKQWVATHIG
jgi:glycosyltransferase involved in cell wall biosynthesis